MINHFPPAAQASSSFSDEGSQFFLANSDNFLANAGNVLANAGRTSRIGPGRGTLPHSGSLGHAEGSQSPEGDAHFLRWRMRERIRRFFRPTLRRPLPRRRAPMRFPQSSSQTFHPDWCLRKPPAWRPRGAPNPLVPGKKPSRSSPPCGQLPPPLFPSECWGGSPRLPPGVWRFALASLQECEGYARLPPGVVEVLADLSPGVVEVRATFLQECEGYARLPPGVVEVRVGLPPGALRIGSTTVPRQPTLAPSLPLVPSFDSRLD
jgi:hypothetical protein